MSLSGEERDVLLGLARAAIARALVDADPLGPLLAGFHPTAGLERRSGVFVTLQMPPAGSVAATELRGCIGRMWSDDPLYRAVIDTAPKAAFEDPRFPPLTAPELDLVHISLSVLSPLASLDDWRSIEIGRHGVQLRRGPHHAVFLPQVAEEQGWGPETLLERLAAKAGLAPQAWHDAELSTFQAEKFGEPVQSPVAGEKIRKY